MLPFTSHARAVKIKRCVSPTEPQYFADLHKKFVVHGEKRGRLTKEEHREKQDKVAEEVVRNLSDALDKQREMAASGATPAVLFCNPMPRGAIAAPLLTGCAASGSEGKANLPANVVERIGFNKTMYPSALKLVAIGAQRQNTPLDAAVRDWFRHGNKGEIFHTSYQSFDAIRVEHATSPRVLGDHQRSNGCKRISQCVCDGCRSRSRSLHFASDDPLSD